MGFDLTPTEIFVLSNVVMDFVSVSKSKKRIKKPKKTKRPQDALSKQHSKRHGEATRKGIRSAKKQKQAILKATSLSKGKTRAEVEADFLEGGLRRCANPD